MCSGSVARTPCGHKPGDHVGRIAAGRHCLRSRHRPDGRVCDVPCRGLGHGGERGRLELILSTPTPRRRLLLARYAAALTGALLAVMVFAEITVAAVKDVDLDSDHVVAAFGGLWVIIVIFVSAGFAVNARYPRATTPVVAVLVSC